MPLFLMLCALLGTPRQAVCAPDACLGCGEPLGPEWLGARFCSSGCEWHHDHDGPIGPGHPAFHVLHNGNLERPESIASLVEA